MTRGAKSTSVTSVVTNLLDPTSCFNTKSSPTEKICPSNVLNVESVYDRRLFWKFTWEVFIVRKNPFLVKCVDSDHLALTTSTFIGSKSTNLPPRWQHTSIILDEKIEQLLDQVTRQSLKVLVEEGGHPFCATTEQIPHFWTKLSLLLILPSNCWVLVKSFNRSITQASISRFFISDVILTRLHKIKAQCQHHATSGKEKNSSGGWKRLLCGHDKTGAYKNCDDGGIFQTVPHNRGLQAPFYSFQRLRASLNGQTCDIIKFQEISLANAKRLLCNPGNCWLAAIILLAAEFVLNTVMTCELMDIGTMVV